MKNKYITLIIAFALSIITANAQMLNVEEVIQEEDQWCWAAVSKCLLKYYSIDMQQCEIADFTRQNASWHDFGDVPCCESADFGCNYWNYLYGNTASIEGILENLGDIKNHGFGAPLSLDKVKSNLAESKPFVIRWGWASGGGHFVLGHGFVENKLYYMNPWFGEGYKIATYDWVLSDNSHTWTHSDTIKYLMNPPTLYFPKDQATNILIDSRFEWEHLEHANSYILEISNEENFSVILYSEKTTQNTADFSDLDIEWGFNQTYYWRVKADLNSSWKKYSETFSFTTQDSNFETWIKLDDFWKTKIDIISKENMIINWDSKNVNKYTIAYRSDLKSDKWTLIPWKKDNKCVWNIETNFAETCQIVVQDSDNPLIADTSKVFKIDIESGVKENRQKTDYRIIPNPAKNTIVIENMKMQTNYKITDLNGILITSGKYSGHIDVNEFASGLYFVVIDGITLKLVIE